MNIALEKFCEKTYRLKNLVRYQTSPRIKEETVLEHLGYTAMVVFKLHDIYEFDLLKAVGIALFHDWAEQEVSDIPHPIKNGLPPDILKRLEDIEVEVIRKDLGDSVAESVKEFNEFTIQERSVEGKIVALADALSVKAYSDKESALGNKDWFEGYVTPYTKKRIDELLKLLRPHKRLKGEVVLDDER